MRRGNDVFESDEVLHRTFKISEWPQAHARLGFLDKFVFAGDFRHTVSLYLRPRGVRGAFRNVLNSARPTGKRTGDDPAEAGQARGLDVTTGSTRTSSERKASWSTGTCR